MKITDSLFTLPSERLQHRKRRRQYWLSAHLWLGLILGLLLSVYGLTGSILVFHPEIDEWLNTGLRTVVYPEGAVYRPLPELFAAGRAAMPEQATLAFATYPRNDAAALAQNYSMPAAGGRQESWQVLVDPYTAQVLGKRLIAASDDWLPKTFIGVVFKLHYALLLPNGIGDLVVGVSGVLLILDLLTGLIVWWPLTGRWLQALTIKRRASAERFNFDLHKTAGFYSTPVLLAVLFSGVYMVLPQQVVPVLELFSPVSYRYWFRSAPQPGASPISMAEAVDRANQLYPSGRPHWIYGAPAATSTYTVCKDGVERPGSWLQRVCVVLDRYSGKVLDLDDPAVGTAGEVFTHWQWPLHSGQAAGLPGRWLVFFTGLACPLLFATGLIRWLQKRRGKRRAGIIQCR